MKKISTAVVTALLLLAVFATITYTACTPSTCKDVLCQNGSICSDGKCKCPAGYIGTHCEIKDSCQGRICQNNGVCLDGKCQCPTGFTGPNCESKSDPCQNVVCQNGGTCVSGKCQCPEGYEGVNCELESRAKFLKKWTADDVTSSGGSVQQYMPEIKAGSGKADLTISNFSNSFFTALVKATFAGNVITIASHAPDAGGYTVSGTGTYNTNTKTIAWTYVITSPSGTPSSYTGTWK